MKTLFPTNFLDTEIVRVNVPLAMISGEPFKQCPKIATFFDKTRFYRESAQIQSCLKGLSKFRN